MTSDSTRAGRGPSHCLGHRLTRGQASAALVLLIAVYAGLGYARRWYADDVFITLRYARHLAAGHGLVWNTAGGMPVEGATSLAWTALNAVALRLGLEPIAFSQGVGGLSGALALVLVYRAGRSLGMNRLLALAAPALLAAQRHFVIQAVSAMEVRPATTLAFAATLLLAREQRRSPPGFLASGLLFFVATLFRPEVPLLHLAAGIGFAIAAVAGPADPALRRSRLLAIAGSGAVHGVLLGLLTAWRLSYFGQPLPNTFYAKVGGVQLDFGISYVYHFARHTHAWLWLPVLVVALPGAWRRRATPGIPLAAALAAQGLIYTAWIAVEGGDLWEFRLLDPIILGWALWVGLALDVLAHPVPDTMRRADAGPRRRLRGPVIATLATALVASQVSTSLRPFVGFYPVSAAAHHQALADFVILQGQALAPYLGPEDRIATGWAGAIPYYTEAWHLDTWGLNDPEIARRPFNPKAILHHQRHATWDDVARARVMFCDIYNRFLFPDRYPLSVFRRAVKPWAASGIPVYTVELPSGGEYPYWIFASAAPADEVECWLREKGLPLLDVQPLP